MSRKIRKNADTRRDEILSKAIELIAGSGYPDTSFQKIATALKLSQSAIMHHFPTKEALLEETVKRIVAHNHTLVQQQIKATDDAVTRLRKHFAGNLDWSVQYRDEAQLILVLYHLAGFSPRFTALYHQVLEGGRARVLELVAAAMREGLYRRDIDAETVAVVLHDQLVGGIIAAICLPATAVEARKIKKRWETALGLFAVNTSEAH